MRTQGIGRLVLEINMCIGTQGLLQSVGTDQRSGTVVTVLVADLVRDVYPRMLLVKLLARAFFIEDMCQVLNMKGLMGSRIERWQRFIGHVGLNVVPLTGNVGLV